MLRDRRWTLDSCSYHVHRTSTDETKLVLLPLQRQPEDVRTTLGVSVVLYNYRPLHPDSVWSSSDRHNDRRLRL